MTVTPKPGDWHETLVDLLAMDRGIPEDRARRFLARHAEEARTETPFPEPNAGTQLDTGSAARVWALARDWEFMSGRTAARRELLAALNGPKEGTDA